LKYKLSKSTFIRGLQCEKSLYLYKKHYKLKDPTSPSLQAVFDQGNQIGVLAQSLFPGGVDATPSSHFRIMESVMKTKAFLENRESIIYEATFTYNEVLAALDILVKDSQGWKAYEVKSSTSVSETYIKDAAIQYYTIINSGINLVDISVVHINNQYVLDGDLDIDQLFTIESVKDRVIDYIPEIPSEIKRLKNVVDLDSAPNIDIGLHCHEPYDCDFKGTCWKHIPEYSIFDISNLNKKKKFDLYNQGILTLDQVDLSQTKLSKNQILQIESEFKGKSHINKEEIGKFLNNLNYPLYYLDFETINPGVPKYQGLRPYQNSIFQYSLHVKQLEDSELIHKEFLADPKKDPRVELIEQLINDCGDSGDILVYNISFERSRLHELIEQFPEHKDPLQCIIKRLKDLMIPFQNKWYYTPEMRGSYSIKYVLPALAPEFSYNDLNIKDGGMASSIFLSMINDNFKGNELLTRQDLLEYCKLDTYAMVKIIEKLKNLNSNF
jgi:hypothetical protein